MRKLRIAWFAALLPAVLPAQSTGRDAVVIVRPNLGGFGAGAGQLGFGAGQLGFGWSAGSPVARRVFVSPYSQFRLNGGVGTSGFGWNTPFLYSGWYGAYINGNQAAAAPASPSYANPAVVQPAAAQPAPLEPPPMPAGAEAAELRSSFASASVSVSAARAALEDVRSRLAAIGQTPRANLAASVASAEAALKLAQQHMTAGALADARSEIQRSGYIARQVLKEFGR
jgi:hypothetical protein